jgi:hypothetical protein
MSLHREIEEGGLLPPMHFDWTAPAPRLLESAAAQLHANGVLCQLAVEVDGEAGSAVIPLLCEIGSESWAPYIEADRWSDEVVLRFVDWLSVVRGSSCDDVHLQIYSPYPVPAIVVSLAENTPMARLQLEAHARTEAFAFGRNSELLAALVRRHFDVELPRQPSSLEVLDRLIAEHLGDRPPLVATRALVHLVGSFLGEIMVASGGGGWEGEGEGEEWRVRPSMQHPLRLAVDRFANGMRAPLSVCVLPA